jgi:class 3 adenylate cyclase
MFGFNRLSIQSKMILLLLLVALSVLAVMAWIGYATGKSSLEKSVRNQLLGIQVAKTTALKTRLESLRDQVVSMSDSRIVLDGMKGFAKAYEDLEQASLSAAQSEQIKDFYSQTFIPKLREHITTEPLVEQYIPSNLSSSYLQYHYLAANPHPYEAKSKLIDAPGDTSSYRSIHEQFHPSFARAAKIFGFEDILLIDSRTLNIVYSYAKTSEFGTSLETGPYSNTKLARKARELQSAQDRDAYKIADFEAYRPSLGLPMAFALSPIFDGSKIIGILALQFPVDSFNFLMTGGGKWREEGLGETGECYLVGPDLTMRSRSRFMMTDPKSFLAELREMNVPPPIVNQIEKQGNVLGVLPVETKSAREALNGESGIMEDYDYRRKKVISAYGPIELDSLRWGVLAEIDADEAYGPIRDFGRKVLMTASAMALLSSLLALLFSNWMIRPLRQLIEGARRLGSGETDVQVPVATKDEFGELGTVFNNMSRSIKTQTDKLEQQIRENEELLGSILPASAIAQRREGDERASQQFTDVSVFFAELIGLEDFSREAGESKALSVLGDLIASLDEAAEKYGIEKVKTIGGAYLAVCGLSVTRPDHARRMAQFAQEVVRIVAHSHRDFKAALNVAIGINSGPVVGGVVGRRKFLYDLWGDTVTIAKKLAVGNGASSIRVTQSVRDRIGDQFQLEGPVQVELEGRSPIEAWQVST